MNAAIQFLQTYVGRFGMFSLVLIFLETILDDNFICPCLYGFNQAVCVLYGFAPAIACFIGTYYFVDVRENEVIVKISRCKRILFSFLTAFVWTSVFFLEGRYLACAYSNWEGISNQFETPTNMQWCKPTGNATSVLNGQQRTLELMVISQFTGFGVMILVIIGFAALKPGTNQQPNTECPQQQPPAEQLPMFKSQDCRKNRKISGSI